MVFEAIFLILGVIKNKNFHFTKNIIILLLQKH